MALLRRYEPTLRFTRGEQFFPVDVERYVAQASLWYQRPGEDAVCALPQGEVTLETLGQVDLGRPGATYFLKFADPLSARELVRYRADRAGRAADRFVPGTGRLARVGYASRFFDAFFNVTLLARGRVPGDTAAAAALLFDRMLEEGEEFRYHGRVVREAGWLILQYWFFYVYNNWRSGFAGANDHEADWELVTLYLAEPDETRPGTADGEISNLEAWLDRRRPEWVAYGTHDREGDDLRRRWDDPEVEKIDEHPVVYVAAGSHACYFRRGEYLTDLEVPFLHPLTRAADVLQRFWHEQLRQYEGEDGEQRDPARHSNLFRIPFVDYARGDGLAIGYGQARGWTTPRLLDPEEGWLSAYRGLWGLYAQDPFAGEDAPAGPMYNRDRSLRRAWYDPAGWSGLDKVAPEHEELRLLVAQQLDLRREQQQLQTEIQEKAFELRNLGMAARAMRTQPHLQRLHADYAGRIETLSTELARLRKDLAARRALLHTLDGYATLLEAGVHEPPRTHIRRAVRPAEDERFRAGRLAEIWAAASIGLMLVVLVGLIYFARHYMVFGLSAMIALFAFVEATFRGRLVRTVTSVTIGLAVVAALVLLYEFFWSAVALVVLVIGSYLLWDNLRELWP